MTFQVPGYICMNLMSSVDLVFIQPGQKFPLIHLIPLAPSSIITRNSVGYPSISLEDP